MNENERLRILREEAAAGREAEYQAEAHAAVDKLCTEYPDIPRLVVIDIFNAGHVRGYTEGYDAAPLNW